MNKLRRNNGITLIALIITIVILLILAVVTIKSVQGDGIIAKAQKAKTDYQDAQEKEETMLEGYLADIEEITGRNPVTFNPETLEIGTAINTDKYGCKVEGYTVTTTDCPSGIWRLFYQDSNYTYLINDELAEGKWDYYLNIENEDQELKYQTGADVSIVGQKLSPTISSLFTESNSLPNIQFTAWMTDTEVWKDYKDDNGDAVFAIGSPTADLFAASYNNRSNKSNTITLGLGTYGYTENTENNWLSKLDNYGIYNKDGLSYWWLASPSNDHDDYGNISGNGLHVCGYCGCFDSNDVSLARFAVRPTVCIPTSVFNSNYCL